MRRLTATGRVSPSPLRLTCYGTNCPVYGGSSSAIPVSLGRVINQLPTVENGEPVNIRDDAQKIRPPRCAVGAHQGSTPRPGWPTWCHGKGQSAVHRCTGQPDGLFPHTRTSPRSQGRRCSAQRNTCPDHHCRQSLRCPGQADWSTAGQGQCHRHSLTGNEQTAA